MVTVKICGLSTLETVTAAVEAGADYVGFVFFPKSPRHVSYQQALRLTNTIPESIKTVAVMVDPSDDDLKAMQSEFCPDYIQLHGDESPHRIKSIRSLTACSIIKAIPIATATDLVAVTDYSPCVDGLLLDAKTPAGTLPGGMGISFDWSLLKSANITIPQMPIPWMLSGGLNEHNVAEAMRISTAPAVDVSSGVESAPGIKDIEKIKRFILSAKQQ